MDKIDSFTGKIDTINKSFLTQLKDKGVISKKTAFFDALGYSEFLVNETISGLLTIGGDLNVSKFLDNPKIV